MGNYSDWAAGRHWRAGMEALTLARDGNEETPEGTTACATVAPAHLAAAKLLLDHPPVDVLDQYPLAGRRPSTDWRNE